MKTIVGSTVMPLDSPWGAVQNATEILPGLTQVSTAGHGGIKLDRRRNAKIPAEWRTPGGWYEEDCAWSIVWLVFARELYDWAEHQAWTDGAQELTEAYATACSWYPEAVRAILGHQVPTAQSYVLREREFYALHAADWVGISAFGDWCKTVPYGMVGVITRLGGHGNRNLGADERCYLVPKQRYDARNHFGYVVNPAVDVPWAGPPR